MFAVVTMADVGLLINVLAGHEHTAARLKPFCLNVIAKAVIDLSGLVPGTASPVKLIGISFVLSIVESLAKGHVLALNAG